MTALSLKEVLSRFPDPKRSGDGWMVKCPSHNDSTASLSVKQAEDGKILLYCHAGCEAASICDSRGIEMKQLFPENHSTNFTTSGRKTESTYNYTDEDGNVLYQVVRYQPKGFSQRSPDGKGGWLGTTKGVRRVPYRLPELIEDIALGRTIYVVEGEKDVDALRALGLAATTADGGSGKWKPECTKSLVSANVVILPDNDEAGEDHAAKVSSSLRSAGITHKIVRLPGLPPKGDASDWISNSGTREQLEVLVATTHTDEKESEGLPRAVCAADVGPIEEIAFRVDELLPSNEPSMFCGDGGSMKTTLVMQIVCAVASGSPAFNHFPTKQAPVLVVSAEDSAAVLQSRLVAIARAHVFTEEKVLPHVHYLANEGAMLDDPKWISHLVDEVKRLGAGLVVLDPLRDLHGGDENSSTEIAPVIKACRAICTAGATVIVIHHVGKAGKDKRTIDRVRGSSALYGAMRSVYFVDNKPDDKCVAVECLKMNRAEKLAPFVVEYRIESDPRNKAMWQTARFDYVLARHAALDKAEQFIIDQTAEERQNTSQLKELAKGTGISAMDIGKALKTLEMRGTIDFVEGPKGAKYWGPLVAENSGQAGQPDKTPQLWLPGKQEAVSATTLNTPVCLPAPLGGKQPGKSETPSATSGENDHPSVHAEAA